MNRFAMTGLAATLAISLAASAAWCGEVSSQRQGYWWMDEIRTAAHSLSVARSGKVAKWPRMTIGSGSGVMPLPNATGPIQADGKLDEPAWKKATSFPVGPIFSDCRGAITLQLSACRDAKFVYVAIESDCDLAELGALTGSGKLFRIGGRAYRRETAATVIELAIPLPNKWPLAMSFNSEVLRRPGGKLPGHLNALGLPRHGKPVWLHPIGISLQPADVAARLKIVRRSPTTAVLSHRVTSAKPEDGSVELTSKGRGVLPYKWQSGPFRLEGFAYIEPVLEELEAARDMVQRAKDLQSTKLNERALLERIGEIENAAAASPVASRNTWRTLYRRARHLRARAHLAMLDAPLLFAKRNPFYAAHIYDDYYTWRPGYGGIYVLETPHDPYRKPTVRPVVDPRTKETLGGGIYRDPELSWDAKTIVFAHKAAKNAWTNICQIDVDGTNLQRLTKPNGYHDITPCYLPDGRIVFTSTRPKGLVPCFNSGVDILHAMNADGGNIHSISSNNVTEFDPSILADGRILYGRWEYVDKTALYMQSLWTMFPDGTNETAFYANNMAKPTAVLDARGVPGARFVVASLTPHNGQAVGAIGMIDPNLGKNNLGAVTNFTPEYPIRMDQGLRDGPCDPWPLSMHDVIITNNAIGRHGIIELVDRYGHRELVHCDPGISCFAPMLVKPRKPPTHIPAAGDGGKTKSGRFVVGDIYKGLKGVKRGEIKRLRVIEETSRVSGLPPGGRWWNQAFLNSWQGAYVVKNFLAPCRYTPTARPISRRHRAARSIWRR